MSGSNRTLGPFPIWTAITMIPRHFRHSTKIGGPRPYENIYEAERWCRDQCGTPNALSRILSGDLTEMYTLNNRKRWCNVNGTFYFKEKNEAFAFRLRWG